jgi:hypothetical protein
MSWQVLLSWWRESGTRATAASNAVVRRLGFLRAAGRRVCAAPRVMRHRRRGAVELGSTGSGEREDVVPHSEADEHAHSQGTNPSRVVGHRCLLDPRQLLRQRGLEVGGDAQRDHW